jgi:hypothetical protein
MKFNGTIWEYVGPSVLTSGGAAHTFLEIYDSLPYIIYRDDSNASKATVMRLGN